MIFQTQFDVPTYDRWVADHDMRSALRWHRRFLQVLQWKAPRERWALKSPQHLWHLQHVHREYPDARFVQTHRDPVRALIEDTLGRQIESNELSALLGDLRRLARLLAPLAEAMERLGGGSSGPRLEAPELRPAN